MHVEMHRKTCQAVLEIFLDEAVRNVSRGVFRTVSDFHDSQLRARFARHTRLSRSRQPLACAKLSTGSERWPLGLPHANDVGGLRLRRGQPDPVVDRRVMACTPKQSPWAARYLRHASHELVPEQVRADQAAPPADRLPSSGKVTARALSEGELETSSTSSGFWPRRCWRKSPSRWCRR